MIEKALWVTTDHFEVNTAAGPNFINPRCFGEDFALWLKPRLSVRGLAVSEPIQEDWGWVILVTVADVKFTIGIGVMDECIGQATAIWRIGVAFEKPLNRIRTWFRSAHLESLEALYRDVQNVLASESGFRASEEEP